MSFIDFVLKYWWIELGEIIVISIAYGVGYLDRGLMFFASIGSFFIFFILYKIGLE